MRCLNSSLSSTSRCAPKETARCEESLGGPRSLSLVAINLRLPPPSSRPQPTALLPLRCSWCSHQESALLTRATAAELWRQEWCCSARPPLGCCLLLAALLSAVARPPCVTKAHLLHASKEWACFGKERGRCERGVGRFVCVLQRMGAPTALLCSSSPRAVMEAQSQALLQAAPYKCGLRLRRFTE